MVLSSSNAGLALGNSKKVEEQETERRSRAHVVIVKSTPLDAETKPEVLFEKLVYPEADP